MATEREQYLLSSVDAGAKDRFVALFAPALGSSGDVYRYDGIDSFGNAWGKGGIR